eukprot:comp24263_c7_seq1/m.45107 comp24263_c7_seq1/g.45107  ORF comp24263_c7_seq1/g.45107 comp24263_c7_seq1/m.45107 type:complete len:205 (-) comp24263_c7_seq1:57-671(-)
MRFRLRNKVESRLGEEEYHTPRGSLADGGDSDSENVETLNKIRELNRQRGKWFGKAVIVTLLCVGVIGLVFSWGFLAAVDSACPDFGLPKCGFFNRFGLSYFMLVQEFFVLAFTVICTFRNHIAEYRAALVTFLNISVITLIRLTTALSTSAGSATDDGVAVNLRLAVVGFVFLDVLNFIVLFMILVPPTSRLGIFALEAIPID